MEDERFKRYIDELERICAETCKDMESFLSGGRRDIDDWCRIADGAIRNEMRTKLRQGIVDGPHLSRALLNEESVQANLIFEKVQEELLAFQVKLRERFQNIREWESERTDFRVGVNREEKTKWEGIFEPLLGSGVAVGGAGLVSRLEPGLVPNLGLLVGRGEPRLVARWELCWGVCSAPGLAGRSGTRRSAIAPERLSQRSSGQLTDSQPQCGPISSVNLSSFENTYSRVWRIGSRPSGPASRQSGRKPSRT